MDSETQQATDTRDTGNRQGSSSGSGNRQSLADQLRQQASDRFSGGKDRAVHGLSSLADAVRQTGQQLRDKDQAGIASYVESLADQAAQFSESLGHKDVGEIVEDVQRFAHRRPALFLGLSFGLGVAGARFLKSSRPRPHGNRTHGGSTGSAYAASGTAYGGSRSGYSTGASFDRTANPGGGSASQPRMAITPPPPAPNIANPGSGFSGSGRGASAGSGARAGASEFGSVSSASVPESAISSTAGTTEHNDTVGAATGEISRNTAAPQTARRRRTEQ